MSHHGDRGRLRIVNYLEGDSILLADLPPRPRINLVATEPITISARPWPDLTPPIGFPLTNGEGLVLGNMVAVTEDGGWRFELTDEGREWMMQAEGKMLLTLPATIGVGDGNEPT